MSDLARKIAVEWLTNHQASHGGKEQYGEDLESLSLVIRDRLAAQEAERVERDAKVREKIQAVLDYDVDPANYGSVQLGITTDLAPKSRKDLEVALTLLEVKE